MKHFALLFTSLLASLCAYATAPTGWYEESVENRPFTRWWWLGSAVDSEGLTHNLEEFAKKGMGGTEITPIYGVQGNEANDIEYLSPRWMDMLEHTVSESRRLGLKVDMNNGTGWPFGGPNVNTDISARKSIIEEWNYKPNLKIVPADDRQKPVATLQKVIAVNGKKRIDISSKVSPDGILHWTAPKGDWKVYALFCGRTFQNVKRAAPGGEGLVLNHYDSIAVKKYLNRFDKAFAGRENIYPETFFNDSYEVYQSDWTENILDEFKREHGYDLGMYLPELKNNDGSDTRARVISDYRHTLARMLYENFTKVWTDWAHSKGVKIRNQSHGSPANIIDLYAAVDIPECESFGQSDFNIPGLVKNGPSRPSDADPTVLKFASSAAHVAGKPLTSAETLTWLTEHFRTSLARCKPEIDQMFCSGVNHVYFHGSPYSPKNVEFPGWLFYASINMSPTNSIWTDADGLFRYIARTQAFLSAGAPDNDFLLYFPIEDVWNNNVKQPYMMFDIHSMDRTMPDVKKAMNEIINAGYDVDYVSDKLLNDLNVNPEGLISGRGDNTYKAIIVPPVHLMQPATLARLLDLAAKGAKLIFVESMPDDVPGLSDLKKRRKELGKLTKKLPAQTASATATKYGKGSIITGPDFASTLALTGAKPETMRTRNGVSMIRRRNEAGGYNYFISLLNDKAIDGTVTLATDAKAVEIFDPMTGKNGLAASSQNPAGGTDVRLQLMPGQSLLLKTFPTPVNMEKWPYYKAADAPMAINKGWKLTFPQSEPAIEGEFAIDNVMPWTKLDNDSAKVNFGTGRYTVNFHIDNPVAADEWMLNLGDVRESARVYVNGTEAGNAWSVPFCINIGEYLKQGDNTLEIDVTNMQANRIADYERRGIKWRKFKDTNINSVTGARSFNFGEWDTVPSGLNSIVTLTPLKRTN